MYNSWEELRNGWTKNLALLFPDARQLARRRNAEFCRLLGLLGRHTEADLDAARTAARKLLKPARYLAEIERIAAGQLGGVQEIPS